MIKVMFRHAGGTYWAVCGSLRCIDGSGYLLDSVMEDSRSSWPHPWTRTPED